MPKSYEMKLRHALEVNQQKPSDEPYKAIEGLSQTMLLGFDHPETLQLEMQLTWAQDTWTVERLHDHLMSEVRRLDMEYRRKPLRCNYTKKYLWFDRFVLRPSLKGRQLTLQDYGIEPGFRVKVNPFFTSERMWGQPFPQEPHKQRPLDKMEACEDPALLRRLDQGPPVMKNRVFFFPWMGGNIAGYIPIAAKMPKDVACFALELPGRGDREMDEGYPSGEFAVDVMARTLAKEVMKPGHSFFFAHSQGSHFAYYVAKKLKEDFRTSIQGLFVSNFFAPAAMPAVKMDTLLERQSVCVPLKIFTGLVQGGWGLDPKMAYKNTMGYCAYQSHEMWPAARAILADHWLTKDFPLPNADELVSCPIVAFYGKDDAAVSLDQVMRWEALTSQPKTFRVIVMDGDHHWLTKNSACREALATELSNLVRQFAS